MNEKLITVKGLHIPELTPDRKTFNPPAQLVRDMENSLEMGRISEVYPDSENAYREAVKHHLIKSTSVNVKLYSYDELKYDKTYRKPYGKYDITYYHYSEDDILKGIQENKMQVISFNEKISIGNVINAELIDEVIVEHITAFDYYPNGQLRYYGSALENIRVGSQLIRFVSMMIGSEYEYDESGNLLKAIDHEQGYTMNFPDVLKFALKNIGAVKEKYKIDIYRVNVVYIRRNKNAIGSFWIIPYGLAYNKVLYQIIDDSTGRIIDEFENDEQQLQKYIDKPVEEVKK